MKGKKGITPLIATVVLIAFVVALAVITSGFFTGFAKQQKGKIEEKGGETTTCGMASIDLQEDTARQTDQGNFSVNVKNSGKVSLSSLNLVLRDVDGQTTTFNVDPSSISSGEIKSVQTKVNVSKNITGGIVNVSRVTVTTNCPGTTSTLKNSSGTWSLVY